MLNDEEKLELGRVRKLYKLVSRLLENIGYAMEKFSNFEISDNENVQTQADKSNANSYIKDRKYTFYVIDR